MKEAQSLKGHAWVITSVAFSPDGERFVTGSFDGTAKVWRTGAAQERTELAFEDVDLGGVHVAAFRPDSARFTTFVHRKGGDTITLCDSTTGTAIRSYRFEVDLGELSFGTARPDGRLLVGDRGRGFFLCDLGADPPCRKIDNIPDGSSFLALSPDLSRLATADAGGVITLMEAASGKKLCSLPDTAQSASFSRDQYASFSPDGSRLLTFGVKSAATLWDARTGKKIGVVGPKEANGWFSPDGTFLLTGGGKSALTLWNAKTGAKLRELLAPETHVYSIAFSPDSRTLAITPGGAAPVREFPIRLFHLPGGEEMAVCSGHAQAVTGLAFSPDGRRLASASGNIYRPNSGEVRLWDVASGSEVLSLRGQSTAVLGVSFSPDGRFLLGKGPYKVVVWDGGPQPQLIPGP